MIFKNVGLNVTVKGCCWRNKHNRKKKVRKDLQQRFLVTIYWKVCEWTEIKEVDIDNSFNEFCCGKEKKKVLTWDMRSREFLFSQDGRLKKYLHTDGNDLAEIVDGEQCMRRFLKLWNSWESERVGAKCVWKQLFLIGVKTLFKLKTEEAFLELVALCWNSNLVFLFFRWLWGKNPHLRGKRGGL